jgi:hypothetical protein
MGAWGPGRKRCHTRKTRAARGVNALAGLFQVRALVLKIDLAQVIHSFVVIANGNCIRLYIYILLETGADARVHAPVLGVPPKADTFAVFDAPLLGGSQSRNVDAVTKGRFFGAFSGMSRPYVVSYARVLVWVCHGSCAGLVAGISFATIRVARRVGGTAAGGARN